MRADLKRGIIGDYLTKVYGLTTGHSKIPPRHQKD